MMRDGTNPAALRQHIATVLVHRGYHQSGPDGWRHDSGDHVTIGYSGRSLRVRRFAPGQRTDPEVLDLTAFPNTAELALFLGEPPVSTAPKLSRREQEFAARFEGVKVVLEHPNAKLPTRGYKGDAGVDLFTSETTVIPPGSFRDVPTGIRLGLPEGYWARIAGRSSTLRRRGLLVAEGVIDNGYTGPIYAGIWNLTDTDAVVAVGERVSQLILHRIEPLEFEQVDDVISVDGRGSNGFGSSGQ